MKILIVIEGKEGEKMKEIFHRTSIRKYTKQPVEKEKIELLLKAAMAAPSAGNQQPWHFYVVTNKELIEQLSECSPYARCLKNAPLALVTCYKKAVKYPEYCQIDLSACNENILLEADHLSLGAVWLGIAPLQDRMTSVKKVLHLEADEFVFSIISIGYPAETKQQQNRYDINRIKYLD